MVREIDPERSRRAAAFALWSRAPMPMVTPVSYTHLPSDCHIQASSLP